MQPPTSTTLLPQSSGAVTQEIRVTNTMQGEKNILIRLKIAYTTNGVLVEEVSQVSDFPPLY